jgi:hypothetical protein
LNKQTLKIIDRQLECKRIIKLLTDRKNYTNDINAKNLIDVLINEQKTQLDLLNDILPEQEIKKNIKIVLTVFINWLSILLIGIGYGNNNTSLITWGFIFFILSLYLIKKHGLRSLLRK